MESAARHPGRRVGLAVLAGIAVAGALPPWGWWPLAVVGIGLWGWLLQQASWKARLGLGAVVGLAHFLIALAWVPEFTVPGYPVLVLLETAFWALASLVCRGRWAGVALAGALTLAEAARYNVPFEGLPLAGIDLGQVGGPFLPAARLGGGYAITLAAGLLGAALGLAVDRRHRSALLPGALALVLPLAGFVSPDGAEFGEPLRTAVVQGGGPVGFRGVETDFGLVFDRHLQATSAVRGPVDLVLWPENAITISRTAADTPVGRPDSTEGPDEIRKSVGSEPMRLQVQTAAARLGAVVVAGVVEPAGPAAFLNLAEAFGPRGRQDSVAKAIRVPFGEYIPFRALVDRVADLSAIPSEAVPGRGAGLLRTSAGTFAVSISYEVLFGSRSRQAVNLGGQVVLVPTNAASFRRSQVPGEELGAARIRAVETGRWLLQAAPTGYSAVVDHRGVVRQRTGISEQTVLRDEVPRRAGSTPFLVVGPWPTLALAAGLVLAGLLAARRQSGGTSGDRTAARP